MACKWWSWWMIQVCLIRCVSISHHGYCGRDPSLLSGGGGESVMGLLSLHPQIWQWYPQSLLTGDRASHLSPQCTAKIAQVLQTYWGAKCSCWGATGSVPLPQFDDCAEFHLMKEWVLPKTFSFGRKVILPNLSLKLIRDLSRDVPWAGRLAEGAITFASPSFPT